MSILFLNNRQLCARVYEMNDESPQVMTHLFVLPPGFKQNLYNMANFQGEGLQKTQIDRRQTIVPCDVTAWTERKYGVFRRRYLYFDTCLTVVIFVIPLSTFLKWSVYLEQSLILFSNGFSDFRSRTPRSVGFSNWGMVLRSTSRTIHEYCTFLPMDVSCFAAVFPLSGEYGTWMSRSQIIIVCGIIMYWNSIYFIILSFGFGQCLCIQLNVWK